MIVVTLIAIVLSVIVGFCESGDRRQRYSSAKAIAIVVFSIVACLLVDLWLVVFIQFRSPYWFDYWIPLFLDILAICSVAVCVLFVKNGDGYSKSSKGYGVWAGLVVFLAFGLGWFVLRNTVIVPGQFCDERGTNRLAALATFETDPNAYEDVDVSEIIQVTQAMAYEKASQAMPAGSDSFGSYLQPVDATQAQLQYIAGHYWYIVALYVTNWQSFANNLYEVPGYFRIDAENPNPVAEFMSGYHIKLVPGVNGIFDVRAWLSESDLDRFAMDHFLNGSNWIPDDLNTLEIDENWNPYYTAALLRPEVSNAGYVVDSYVVIDPQIKSDNYQIYPIVRSVNEAGVVTYDTSQVPSWVNRIFSIGLIDGYVTNWAQYANHVEVCWTPNTEKQFRIDAFSPVVTNQGLTFQYSLTAQSSDQTMSYLMYADPRTGRIVNYETSGELASPTFERIRETMLATVQGDNGVVSYEVDHLQFQWMLGHPVVFGTVTMANTSNYFGAVLVQPSLVTTQGSVIFGSTIDEAYAQFARQIASGGQGNIEIDESSTQIQVTGIIGRIGYFSSVNRNERLVFTLISDQVGPTVRFVVDTDANTALLQPGDSVIVTALNTIDPSAYNEVYSVTNVTFPSLELPTPTVAP